MDSRDNEQVMETIWRLTALVSPLPLQGLLDPPWAVDLFSCSVRPPCVSQKSCSSPLSSLLDYGHNRTWPSVALVVRGRVQPFSLFFQTWKWPLNNQNVYSCLHAFCRTRSHWDRICVLSIPYWTLRAVVSVSPRLTRIPVVRGIRPSTS